ncbi:GFA family protein [Sphingopyxis sp. PET50]|uniref:GFA family protein n=1 Tax=Sphingopyxis sp. PET50 TaxID=2976533 RepID=UPI0028AB1000|nr:GFA family protein [Sphingopyxis sp. PET50]
MPAGTLGAPIVGWALVGQDELEVTGTPKIYASSEHGRRHFCGDCGTGLFYTSDAVFPGQIDVQSATLDDPDLIPAQAQIQTAERIRWMDNLADLPAFERYPG